jgi:hypothetical protein
MSTTLLVENDERTAAVENAGFRWAYILLSFALLVDVMYRGMFRHEAAWDLLALAIVGGAVCTVHQARLKTLPNGWAWQGALIACVAGVIGAIVAAVMLWSRG